MMETMNESLDNIFAIQDVAPDRVIVKVLADNPLTIAQYPFLSSEFAYITVTRGENHLVTIVRKDGTTTSFHFGSNGYTLISDNLEMLKSYVLQFIEDSDILISYDGGSLTEAKIYYNSYFGKWQLTIDPAKVYYWSKYAHDSDEMIEDCKRFVTADSWEKDMAKTGIDIWKAVNPKFNIK